MARDKDLLSDKEFFRKTSDIAEHMIGCKIDVVFWNDDNKVIDKKLDGKGFILNVATPAVKGIEKFTAFNHELGHIIMRTPIPEAKELVDRWVKDEELSDEKRKLYWDTMNVLEDQRIESLMSRLWLANKKRFVRARTNRGKLHKECNNNPVNIILNIRFFRDDLVKKHKYYKKYKQALEDVCGLGRLGALILLKKLKPMLDEWLVQEPKDIDKFTGEPLDGSDIDQMSNSPSMIEDDTTFIDDIDDFSDVVEESRNDAKNDIDKLKSSMSGTSRGNILKPTYLKPVTRVPSSYEVDNILSHNLRKLFRNVSEMPKSKIGYDGDEIDMESYIEGKIRGYDINNCFVDKKIVNGLSIVISIDGSMSMRNFEKMSKVRNLVATLFDSIEDYDNIKIKANVWSSNNRGDVGITNINNIDDCDKITCENKERFALTPTHLALDYASRILKTMSGRKKLLILITDGQPQYQSWNYNISTKTLLKMNKKAVLKARRYANEIVVLSVGVDFWGNHVLKEVFGKSKVVSVRDMSDGGRILVNKFKLAVLDTLK
jgi:hypothetical protein